MKQRKNQFLKALKQEYKLAPLNIAHSAYNKVTFDRNKETVYFDIKRPCEYVTVNKPKDSVIGETQVQSSPWVFSMYLPQYQTRVVKGITNRVIKVGTKEAWK